MKFVSGKNDAKLILFVLMLLVSAAELLFVQIMKPFESRVLDNMVRRQAEKLVPDRDIVIVDIDDGSLEVMRDKAGKWPWPRSVYAEMLVGIQKQRPKAIVFDITFSEKDSYRPDLDQEFNDFLAEDARAGHKNIYFPMTRLPQERDRDFKPAAEVAELLGLVKGPGARDDTRIAIQPPLALDTAYWRTGAVNFSADSDGTGRRYELWYDAYGWQIPSMAAKVASELGYKLPQDKDLLLHWRGGKTAFQHIPFFELYADFEREKRRRPPNELEGKIVIIGADASSLNDLKPTPIYTLYPGVQIQATALDNLKNQRYMRMAPAWTVAAGTLLALSLLFWSFNRGHNVLQMGVPLFLLSLGVLLGVQWAVTRLMLVPAIVALVLVWLYYFAGTVQAYLVERKSRQETVQMFSRFVNPHVVQQLMATGSLSRAGESREVSVLFSDIRGFTSLSENRTPQEVVSLLNRYFTLQVEVIFRHGGSLDKFIGDCIMAFWGAPLDDPKHAQNAVNAAMEMADVLQQFKKEIGDEQADFDVGIGIHSGPAVVGLIGSDQRREYTAIGDTVNLASRIEGLTKGVARILVSEETMAQCDPSLIFTPYGSFEVKGRAQQVRLFGPQKGN